MKKIEQEQRILFFDGVCHLCNGLVNFLLLVICPGSNLLFAPLQSQTAKEKLPENLLHSLDTVVFIQDNAIYTKSEAIIRALISANRLFTPLRLLLVFPTGWMDKLYQFIAQRRYQIFGQTQSCRLPSEKDKKRLLY